MPLLIVALGLAGCGDKTRASVSGSVTLDGKPLEGGAINFFPTGNSKGPSAGGNIKDGKYQVEVEKGVIIGVNKVEIRAALKTGRMIANPMGPGQVEEWAEAVPEKYNAQTELERTISSGHNEINFELTGRNK